MVAAARLAYRPKRRTNAQAIKRLDGSIRSISRPTAIPGALSARPTLDTTLSEGPRPSRAKRRAAHRSLHRLDATRRPTSADRRATPK
ncbi:hypothetical protein [Actinomadura madurae]|uniref:hypothetical protein n=1 Tax=Actinomadura madurae TaxID=1993 RepID=UPI0011608581|nr:hypothetical protein [Actinomadura madurae]